MRFSLASYGDHYIVDFIDPAMPRWVYFHRATQRSCIPHGNNCYYKLRLGTMAWSNWRSRKITVPH